MAHDAAIAAVAADVMGSPARDVRALAGGISNLKYLVRLAPPAEAGAVVVRLYQRANLRLGRLRGG